MKPQTLQQFLWIQHARLGLALALVVGMLLVGFWARSPWVVLLVTPLFTLLYVLGKWAALKAAWRSGGARKVLFGLAVTLPIQAVVVGTLYLAGLGAGRLFGRSEMADLATEDAWVVLAMFGVCTAACVLIILVEARLRRQGEQTLAAAATGSSASPDQAPVPSADSDVSKTDASATDLAISSNAASAVQGRIFFAGNPWPLGHRVVSCSFNASVHPDVGAYAADYPNPGPGLMLEFELTTAAYDEDSNDSHDEGSASDAEAESDWTSKIVWNNYGNARIGPSQSSQVQGIRVSDGSTPFVFDLPEYRFTVDALPVNAETFHETAGFGIYLLGHDSVAHHDIRLHNRLPDGSYTLDWSGKIALTYSGGDEFKHDFRAHVTGVRFDTLMLFYFDVQRVKEYCGIALDPKLSARDYIAPFVADADNFVFATKVDGVGRSVVSAQRRAPLSQGQ